MRIGVCLNCKKIIIKKNKNQKFCNRKCQYDYSTKNYKNHEYVCTYCGKKFSTFGKKHTKDIFCCHEHSVLWHSAQAKEERICEECGNTFICNRCETLRFCSMKCQGKWFSKTYIGEKSARYKKEVSKEKRRVICDTCGKTFYVRPSDIGKKRFCSEECFIHGGTGSYTVSHLKIIELLKNNNINIRSEVKCSELGFNDKRYRFDIVIDNKNIIIEVMGDYWHRNPQIYNDNMNYENRIKDIQKKEYIINIMKYRLLYLWEYDINNNADKCLSIILDFINSNDSFKNSFDYITN